MPDASMLVDSQRYDRIREMPWIGATGLAQLHGRKVAVIGVGNIGGQIAQHLVLLGLAVTLIDRGTAEQANLGTQGFREDQLGVSKVEARAQLLSPLNPLSSITPRHADIRDLGLGSLRAMDVLCCCLDSRAGRVAVNEIAVRLGIPWVDGALDGTGQSFFARVACYNPRQSGGACYLCPHDATSLRAALQEEAGGGGCSAGWRQAQGDPAPTLAISALGGAVASLQALWTLKILLGRSAEVSGRETYFDLDLNRLTTHQLRHNPSCLLDHRPFELVRLRPAAARTTVEQTLAEAEKRLGGEVALEVHGRLLVGKVDCPKCGAERYPYCLGDKLRTETIRCECGAEMRPSPLHLIDRFGREQSEKLLGKTWHEIGLPRAEIVTATGAGREVHFLFES